MGRPDGDALSDSWNWRDGFPSQATKEIIIKAATEGISASVGLDYKA
jgi:hypothetical protein